MNYFKRLMMPALVGLLAVGSLASVQAATYTAKEKANMKVVAGFFAALDAGEAHGDLKKHFPAIAEKYVQPGYIQHMAAAAKFAPGRAGLIQMFESMPKMPPRRADAPPPTKVVALWANGNLVIRVSTRTSPGPNAKTSYIFNMFRMQDGKLAEHWDNSSANMADLGAAPDGGPPGGSPPGASPAAGSGPGA